jgi:hypothetical protein
MRRGEITLAFAEVGATQSRAAEKQKEWFGGRSKL